MNAHRHRLIFNRARGLVMAVAEIACARGKSPANGDGPAPAAPPAFTLARLRPAAFAALLAVGAQLSLMPLASAQIVAYKAAPPSQRPTVLTTGNGVPLVNIQTPSTAGVSRNSYAQFDVQTQGAILNNSRGNVQTQLGGWVQGNPWLARGSARVILNEVVSANPSQLLGYVEVAGAPAQVVIANPAGVTCNGCGFINASRATLTTGTPIVSGGNLDGYRVEGGTIRIDGAGMDASRVGYTDLIARAVEVNAGLWAQTLKVTAGANTVNAGNSQATPIPGSGPAPVSGYSIDVAQLGGMYAGKITLVGTEAGVGVRNAGTLGASAGEVVVTVDGRLINRGDLLATANVELAAQGIDNSGKIGAQHNVVIRNQGDLANTGAIVGARELILTTTGKLTNDGGSLEAQRLDLDAGDLDNLRGKIRQTGSQALAIDSRTLANRNDGVIGRMPLTGGDTGGGTGSDTSGDTSGGTSGSTSGETSTTTGTTIPTTPVLLADGRIAVSGAIVNDHGEIVANGGTSLASHAGFDNRARIDVDQLTTRGSFANAGGRIVAQRADIGTDRLDNTGGDIVIHERLDLKAHDVANAGGSLQLTGNADLAVHLAGDLDNSAGRIASNGANLTLAAATLANADGRIEHAGSGAFTVSADTLAGTRGRIVSNGTLALTVHSATLDAGETAARTLAIRADALSNQGGRIAQTGGGEAAVRVAGRLDNRGGSIASRGGANLGVGELANEGGAINSVEALHTDVTRHLDNAGGALVAGTDLALAAASANNAGGILGAIAGKLTATATGTLDNTNGRIEAATDLTLANGGLVNAGGTVLGKTLAVDTRAQAFNNRAGRLIAEDTLDLHSGALDNHAGLIQAGGTLTVDTHGQRLANTAAGEAGGILGQKTVTLKAGAFDNAAGFVGAREALAITADTLASTAGGRLVGETDVALTARQIDHRGGQTQAAGKLTVRTTEAADNGGGLMRAGSALDLTAGGQFANAAGTLVAGTDLALAAASANNTGGTLGAVTGKLTATVTGALDNTSGRIEAATDLTLANSGLVNAGGTVFGKTLAVDTRAQALNNRSGRLVADGVLDLHSGALDNAAGLIQAGGTLSVDTHGQALANTASGESGGILGQKTVTLKAGALDNAAGFVGAREALVITADTLASTAGGRLVGETDVTLTARRIDHRGGKTQAAGALTVRATESADNAGGLMRAGGTLSVDTASLGNTDTLGANQGIEGHAVTLTANAIGNRNGAVRADTALSVTSGGTIDNRGGLISALQSVTLRDPSTVKTLAVTNTGGTVIAGRQLDIDAASLAGGKLLSLGDLAVTLAADYTHSGELTANGRAALSTAGTLTNTARLQAGEALALTAATLDNRAGGEILAPELRLAATAANTLINRGLIDGNDTRIDAITLNNLGTGRLYGDHLAIAATTLNNHAEGGTAPVIAARSRLDLGVTTLSNRDGALIFSAGDLAIGGALDANRLATGRAGSVINTSADIEALGNLWLDAARLENRDTRFRSAFVDTGAVAVQEYQNYGSPYRYAPSQVRTYLAKPNSDQWVLYLSTPTDTSNNWYRYDITRRTTETVLLDSRAASISAGNALSIRADAVVNDKSRLVAGGDLAVSAGSIDNLSAAGQRTETASGTATHYYRNRRSSGLPAQGVQTSAYNPAPVVAEFSLAAAVYGGHQAVQGSGFAAAGQAAGSVGQGAPQGVPLGGAAGAAAVGGGSRVERSAHGPAVAGNTAVAVTGTGSATPTVAGNAAAATPRIVRVDLPATGGAARAVATVDAPVRLPANRLYRQNPDPAARVLVETDPRFADHRQWLSSDTMLKALALDPATTQKRLGDGFYEQRLIIEQVGQLTGRRFLAGFDNDETQYRALMSAGVAFAKEWQLVPGVALSAEQMARLTSDIVWLVEKTVTLADGSVQKALVPQVYARVRDGDLAPSGALIAGRNLDLAAAGQLVNEGAIAGSGRVSLAATDLVNRGGLIAGREVALAAEHDLDHRGGLIAAEDRLSLAAGGNIVVASDTYRSEAASGSREGIARLATLYARGPGATLDVVAGGDLTLSAARLEADAATLGAGGDLRLTAVSERNTETLNDRRASRTQTDTRDLGTRIETRGDLVLQAGGDLALDAARLRSGGTLAAGAGGELSVRAGRERSEIAGRLGRASIAIGREGAVAGELAGERVALAAAGDLTVAGSRLTAAQDMTLAAGGDLALATVTERTRNDWEKGDGRNWRRESTSREVGSTLAAGGDLRLAAGRDLTARAADVTSAQGAVVASAGRDLTIEAGEAAYRLDQASYKKKSGALSSKTTITRDTVDSTSAIAATFSGDTVTLVADRDLAVTGSNVVATNDTTLIAGRDLAIAAATETHAESHLSKTKQSGVFGSGGVGVTLGSRMNSTDQKSEATTAAKSTVGSVEGSVTLLAGEQYRQVGSDVIAPQGDIDIAAKRVEIVEARETSRSSIEQKSKQSGFTLAFTSPVITAVQTAQQMAEAAKNTQDDRMKALAAANTGLAGYNAWTAVQAGQGTTIDSKPNQIPVLDESGKTIGTRDATAADQAGGVGINLSLGSSKSRSRSTQASDTAAVSTLSAGRDVTITASGAGENSDIVLQGTQASAARNLTLAAEDEIKLLAAKNTFDQKSTNKNSSASIGIGFMLGGTQNGFTIQAGVSGGKGRADGSDVSHTNTRVAAGDTLTLKSGGDTTLQGAVAKGEQVRADIGGKLAIESLQDTSTYDSQQKSLGVSVSLCIPPFCYGTSSGSVSASGSKVTSDYASVVEQSAIRAGDGGFQVEVKGDTDLKGGAITSTDKAVEENRNRFATGGELSLSDIRNHAEYSAKSASVNVGTGFSAAGALTPQGTSAGFGKDGDSASSTTQAAISGIAGNTAARTGDAETGLQPIFDQQKVQKEIDAQVKITQTFNALAPKAAATYASDMATSLKKQAESESDPAKKAELLDEAKKWGANGSYTVAMNIIIGAAGGNFGSSVTKEALSWAANEMRQAMIEDSKKFKGICDTQGNCLSNMSGESIGVNGDGVKVAGGRIVLADMCDKGRCETDPSTKSGYKENPNGTVIFNPGKDAEGNDMTIRQFLDQHPEWRSPMGGHQGGQGQMVLAGIQFNYEKGSFWDKLAEAYAGSHDTFNKPIWYDELGNGKKLDGTIAGKIGDITNITNVGLATPFALSALLPPEVWNAIISTIKSIR